MSAILTNTGIGQTTGAGYMFNDNTVSGGKKEQQDVLCCTHCQKIILYQDWKKKGAYCRICVAPICLGCGEKMKTEGCVPFMKKIEKQLEANYRRQQLTNRR